MIYELLLFRPGDGKACSIATCRSQRRASKILLRLAKRFEELTEIELLELEDTDPLSYYSECEAWLRELEDDGRWLYQVSDFQWQVDLARDSMPDEKVTRLQFVK